MKAGVFTVGLPDLTPEQAVREVKAAGYDGWLVMEDFGAARPSREALRHNLGFVRELLQRAPARS